MVRHPPATALVQTTSLPQPSPNGSPPPIYSAWQLRSEISAFWSCCCQAWNSTVSWIYLGCPFKIDSCYLLSVTLSLSWHTSLQLHLTTLITRVCFSFLSPNLWRLFPLSGILLSTNADLLFTYPQVGWLTPTGSLTPAEMPLPLGRPLTSFRLLGVVFKKTWPLVSPAGWTPAIGGPSPPSPVLRTYIVLAFSALRSCPRSASTWGSLIQTWFCLPQSLWPFLCILMTQALSCGLFKARLDDL